jgi:predicted permease
MGWWRVFLDRLRALRDGDAVHREIDEEMRFHLDMRAEEYVRRGMSPEEARREAQKRFGRLTGIKEMGYDVRGGGWLETLWQDLRFGTRMLLKQPGFTLIAVLTLTLSIGANTAIFSVVNAVLLRQLPYADPTRLVMIWEDPGSNPRNFVNPRNFADWQVQNRSFDHVAAINIGNVNLTGDGEPERLISASVSATFFSILGVNAAHGRTLLPGEDQPGGASVVVISHSLWQRRFGSDPGLIGQSIELNGDPAIVVGVMPAGFHFPGTAEIWRPLVFTPGQLESNNRGSHFLSVVARLKPGVTVPQAQAEMEAIYNQLRQQYPSALTNWQPHVASLHEDTVGNVRQALLILLGAVGFVLLIACSNVANLTMARAAARQREIAIRAALGASRARLLRQMLTESLLLALLGGGLGVLLGAWLVRLLVSLNPGNLPRLEEVRLDGYVLLFTTMLSLASGLIFGLVPALQSSKINLNEALKDAAVKTSAGRRQAKLRRAFVIAEIALSLVLLVGAGLLIKSFVRLGRAELGFNPANVLTLRVALPGNRYAAPPRQTAFYQQVIERVKSLPGAQAASLISDPPVSGSMGLWQNGFHMEGKPLPPPGQGHFASLRWITPDYFKTLGIQLLRGRVLTEADVEGQPRIVVIDEAMARQFFPDEDPLGKRIVIYWRDRIPREIVGVVGNVRQTSLAEDAGPHIYIPYSQTPLNYATLLVRTTGDPLSLAAAVKREVLAVDRDQPVYAVQTMEQIIDNSVAERRFQMTLLGLFAGVALMLAAMGIYGVMAYTVTQRTPEIGIRIALGAQGGDVLRLVIGQGMKLASGGILIGLLASLGLTQLMKTLLYGVSATDPLTFASIVVLLTFVAVLACWIPARRATKVDPLVALRHE